MLLRIEAFGRYLHVETGKDKADEDSPEVRDTAYPMQVPAPRFVGFRMADEDPGDWTEEP